MEESAISLEGGEEKMRTEKEIKEEKSDEEAG